MNDIITINIFMKIDYMRVNTIIEVIFLVVIDFDIKRGEQRLVNGEVLYNLDNLQEGEALKVYSKVEDLFNNEKTDIYTIIKEWECLYLIFSKNISLNGKKGYYTKDKVTQIGVSAFNADRYKEMNLTKAEIEALKNSSFEYNTIRRGYTLEGIFENGFTFKYPNIILVTKETNTTNKEDK
jgi:hypothetical protein